MVKNAFLVAIMSIGMIVSVSAMQIAVHDMFDEASRELGAANQEEGF